MMRPPEISCSQECNGQTDRQMERQLENIMFLAKKILTGGLGFGSNKMVLFQYKLFRLKAFLKNESNEVVAKSFHFQKEVLNVNAVLAFNIQKKTCNMSN